MMDDEKAGGLHDGGWSPVAQGADPVRTLGQQTRKRIGAHLRAMYDSVVQQPIPNRFTDLIAQLEDEPADAAAASDKA